MATRTTYTLHDDLDGNPADETVPFELDGTAYTIDLSAAHAADFRAALTPFVQAANLAVQRQAHRTELQGSARRGRPGRHTGGQGSSAQRRAVNAAIRVWARDAGYEVSDRGRLKGTIVEEYHRATAGQSPVAASSEPGTEEPPETTRDQASPPSAGAPTSPRQGAPS